MELKDQRYTALHPFWCFTVQNRELAEQFIKCTVISQNPQVLITTVVHELVHTILLSKNKHKNGGTSLLISFKLYYPSLASWFFFQQQ